MATSATGEVFKVENWLIAGGNFRRTGCHVVVNRIVITPVATNPGQSESRSGIRGRRRASP